MAAPAAAADFSETRRKLLPPASSSRRPTALLANNKEEVALPQGEPRFDVDAASAAIDRAMTARSNLVTTSGSRAAFYLHSQRRNRALAEHLPVVYVEPAFGAGANPRASYRVVITLPEAHARDARLLWLKNAATGQVLASKAFAKQGGSQQGGVVAPPTIIASLLEPYGGVRRGTAIVPYVFYDEDGLFEGQRSSYSNVSASVLVLTLRFPHRHWAAGIDRKWGVSFAKRRRWYRFSPSICIDRLCERFLRAV